MKTLLEKFLKEECKQKICYNEVSLQHELAYFLRKNEKTVYFEKSVGYYFKNDSWAGKYDNTELDPYKENKTIKQNIDLVVNGITAIELKFPKKNYAPNFERWNFIKDIKFLEEMVSNKNCSIEKGFFIIVFDHSKIESLYKGDEGKSQYSDLYTMFRSEKEPYVINLKKDIPISYPHNKNPKEIYPLELENNYNNLWNIQKDKLSYLIIEINS